MAGKVSNTQVILSDYVSGDPTVADFSIATFSIDSKLPEGSEAVLLKNLYLSCDPSLRNRMSEPSSSSSFLDPFQLGKPISGLGVSEVIDSGNQNFIKGDLVMGLVAWEEYSVVNDPESLSKIKHKDVPLFYYIDVLGMTGLTAYAGFYEICAPKKGETVFVSVASGDVGQLVGQFAKLTGCFVVGSAESKEKVDLLKNKFGFDDAFNYNEEADLDAALRRYFPEGIDIYFASIGGKMLDAVLLNMKIHGRISMCGLLSQHDFNHPEGVHNLFALVIQRIRMEGFMVLDYYHLYDKYLEMVIPHIKEGKIVHVDDIVHGLESGPKALIGTFSGLDAEKKVIAVDAQ